VFVDRVEAIRFARLIWARGAINVIPSSTRHAEVTAEHKQQKAPSRETTFVPG